MTWPYGPVPRTVGVLALTLGRPDEAERRLRCAMATCKRTGARAFLTMARCDLGELVLPSSEPQRLNDQAGADAVKLGVPGLAERARAAAAP